MFNVPLEHPTFCSKHLYLIFYSINNYGDLIPVSKLISENSKESALLDLPYNG